MSLSRNQPEVFAPRSSRLLPFGRPVMSIHRDRDIRRPLASSNARWPIVRSLTVVFGREPFASNGPEPTFTIRASYRSRDRRGIDRHGGDRRHPQIGQELRRRRRPSSRTDERRARYEQGTGRTYQASTHGIPFRSATPPVFSAVRENETLKDRELGPVHFGRSKRTFGQSPLATS